MLEFSAYLFGIPFVVFYCILPTYFAFLIVAKWGGTSSNVHLWAGILVIALTAIVIIPLVDYLASSQIDIIYRICGISDPEKQTDEINSINRIFESLKLCFSLINGGVGANLIFKSINLKQVLTKKEGGDDFDLSIALNDLERNLKIKMNEMESSIKKEKILEPFKNIMIFALILTNILCLFLLFK